MSVRDVRLMNGWGGRAAHSAGVTQNRPPGRAASAAAGRSRRAESRGHGSGTTPGAHGRRETPPEHRDGGEREVPDRRPHSARGTRSVHSTGEEPRRDMVLPTAATNTWLLGKDMGIAGAILEAALLALGVSNDVESPDLTTEELADIPLEDFSSAIRAAKLEGVEWGPGDTNAGSSHWQAPQVAFIGYLLADASSHGERAAAPASTGARGLDTKDE